MMNLIQETFERSHSWFLDDDGRPIFVVDGISLGLVAQMYIFDRLVSHIGTQSMSGPFAHYIKNVGLDGQVKFLYGLTESHRLQRPANVILLFDVRNFAKISALNNVAFKLIEMGVPPTAVLSDPGMNKYVKADISRVAYSAGFRVDDEFQSNVEWRRIRQLLLENRTNLVAKFDGASNSAESIYRFLFPFFKQTIRDIKAIRRLHNALGWSSIVSGTDAHRLGRLFALMGNATPWRSLVIQHGAPISPHAYVPVFADKIAVWGDAIRDWFLERDVPADKIAVTGNPRYDDIAVSNALQSSRTLEPKIVFLTNILEDRLRSEAVDIAVKTSELTGLPLVIKVHPSEGVEYYRRFSSDRIRVAHNKPLSEIVVPGDQVISVMSTAGIEALRLGATLHVLKLEGIPDAIPFKKYDVAQYWQDHESLSRGIRNDIEENPDRSSLVARFVRDYLGEQDGRASERVARLALAFTERLDAKC